jgi:hypothetical protein
MFTSLNQLWLVAWKKLVMLLLFNLNLYESFCPHITNSLFIGHHFYKEFFELSFLLPNGFWGPISALSRLFPRWDKQVISKLHFLCSSMPNFMWMSIENEIEMWINGQKNQLHFETCLGRTHSPSNGTTAQPPGLTAFLVGGSPLHGLFLVSSQPFWVGGAPLSGSFLLGSPASLCGEGPSTWVIP